MDKNLSM